MTMVEIKMRTAFCVALLSLGLGPATVALAQQYNFTMIDYPNAITTFAGGINASGQVAGTYADAIGNHGFFLDSDGMSFTSFDFPGVTDTGATGINASGQVVGTYAD